MIKKIFIILLCFMVYVSPLAFAGGITDETDSSIQMNGANDGQVFTDTTGNLTWNGTDFGDVYTKTGDKVFGTASAYLDGVSKLYTSSITTKLDYYASSATDSTIDMFVKPSNTSTEWIFAVGENGDTNDLYGVYKTSTAVIFVAYNTAQVINCTATHSLSTSAWTHIRVQKKAALHGVYIGGDQKCYSNDSSTTSLASIRGYIGDANYSSGIGFTGSIDEVRFQADDIDSCTPQSDSSGTCAVPTEAYSESSVERRIYTIGKEKVPVKIYTWFEKLKDRDEYERHQLVKNAINNLTISHLID